MKYFKERVSLLACTVILSQTIAVSSFGMFGCPSTMMGYFSPVPASEQEGRTVREKLIGALFSDPDGREGTICFVSNPNVAYEPNRSVSIGLQYSDGSKRFFDDVPLVRLLRVSRNAPSLLSN